MADSGAAAPDSIVEEARAKINLALHVIGRRDDGYHLLDSLVVFAEAADRLEARPMSGKAPGEPGEPAFDLVVSGPFSQYLPDPHDNLVMQAALRAREACRLRSLPHIATEFQLTKSLPCAAGIGGGSADAAATLRALESLWLGGSGMNFLSQEASNLGADVPVCLAQRAARIRGIGEKLAPATLPHDLAAVLVNPGQSCSTASVFAGLSATQNSPLPALPEIIRNLDQLVGWLAGTRNDLQDGALAIAPGIRKVLDALSHQSACRFAAMSGSGATCYGLFETPFASSLAASQLRSERPDWWIEATFLNPH